MTNQNSKVFKKIFFTYIPLNKFCSTIKPCVGILNAEIDYLDNNYNFNIWRAVKLLKMDLFS